MEEGETETEGVKVLDVASSSDNAQLLAGGMDRCLNIIDVETGKMLRRWRTHAGERMESQDYQLLCDLQLRSMQSLSTKRVTVPSLLRWMEHYRHSMREAGLRRLLR